MKFTTVVWGKEATGRVSILAPWQGNIQGSHPSSAFSKPPVIFLPLKLHRTVCDAVYLRVYRKYYG